MGLLLECFGATQLTDTEHCPFAHADGIGAVDGWSNAFMWWCIGSKEASTDFWESCLAKARSHVVAATRLIARSEISQWIQIADSDACMPLRQQALLEAVQLVAGELKSAKHLLRGKSRKAMKRMAQSRNHAVASIARSCLRLARRRLQVVAIA